MQPQFERTHILIGDEGIARLASRHVRVALHHYQAQLLAALLQFGLQPYRVSNFPTRRKLLALIP